MDSDSLNDLTQKQLLSYASDLTETYRELQKKVRELEILNKKKTDFLSMVSHEIKTPVTIISFIVHSLEEKLGAETIDDRPGPNDLESMLETLKRKMTTLNAIMSEIILAARQDHNEVSHNFNDLELNSAIEELVNEITPFLNQRKQTLIVEFEDKELLINADKFRLYDVLFNIVQNASKFSEDGKNIYIRTRKKENQAVIEIEDYGIGIEKDKLDAIFTPFYEEADILSHHSGSFEFRSSRLGMGLYITKRIIEAHGGRIHVESTPGKGSKFTILLTRVTH